MHLYIFIHKARLGPQFIIMQNSEPSIDDLIKLLINPEAYNNKKKKKSSSSSPDHEQPNKQIENLDIDDYLQLFAHQKKHLSEKRWAKLHSINQSLQMEQESYKHFLAIASQANYRRLEHPGYFKLLLTMVNRYPPSFFVAIQKDIPRTLTSTNPFQQLLRNVLYAYAIRNPSLLYCQGMNYIVAYLLINEMSQEQSFWFMACLIENFLPDDYFKDLTTVSITTCIFNLLLEEVFPEFKLEMNDVGMEPSIILVPWFVCLFTKGFINSVSAYLLSYLLLEGRKYRVGFVMLKISLGLMAIVISNPASFALTKDFKTFKELLETRIFQISLEEIQQNLQLIDFDYEVYVKIEDHYRREKELVREDLLKGRDKKIPLPPCNPDFPVCFHRIEMEKRLGCIQNALILKNGFDIRKQMVQNYLDQPHNEELPSNIHYTDAKECPIGRQAHICHLNAQDYHISMNSRKLKLQRDTLHTIEVVNEESVQQQLQLSTLEERFAEHSEYFQIDENYIENQINCDEEFKRELQEFSREKGPQDAVKEVEANQQPKQESNKEKVSLRAKLGNVFKIVIQKMGDINKTKELRRSQCDLSPKKQVLK